MRSLVNLSVTANPMSSNTAGEWKAEFGEVGGSMLLRIGGESEGGTRKEGGPSWV